MNSNRNETAKDAYAKRATDIAKLMDVLQMELERHAEATTEDEKNWGRVGDLGKVRSDLLDTLSFLSGFDRKDIEDDFLNA